MNSTPDTVVLETFVLEIIEPAPSAIDFMRNERILYGKVVIPEAFLSLGIPQGDYSGCYRLRLPRLYLNNSFKAASALVQEGALEEDGTFVPFGDEETCMASGTYESVGSTFQVTLI